MRFVSRVVTLSAAAVFSVAAVLLSAHPLASKALALTADVAIAWSAWDVETALGILLVFLPLRTLAASMVPLPLRFVADTVVFVLALRLLLLHPERLFPLDRIEQFLIAFAGVGFLVTLHAHAHMSGAALELRDLLLFPVLYAVVRRLHRLGDGPRDDFWERVLPVGLAAIAVVGVQGLIAILVVHHPFLVPNALAQVQAHISAVNRGRPYGWLDNPNVFGELGFIALALTYHHFRLYRFQPTLVFVVLATIFSAMIVFSYSRSTYIVLLVGAAVFTFSSSKRLERSALLAAVAVIMTSVLLLPTGRARIVGAAAPTLAAATLSQGSRHGHRAVRAAREGRAGTRHDHAHARTGPSKHRVMARHHRKGFARDYIAASARSGRLHTLVETARLVRRFPLGTGLGTFGSSGSRVFGTTLTRMGINQSFYADDNYAVILVETGIPGFLVFLLAGLAVFLTLRRLRATRADRSMVWVLFVTLTVLAFTGDAWEQLNLTFYPWLALAVLAPFGPAVLSGDGAADRKAA